MVPDKEAIIKELGIDEEIFRELIECFVTQTEEAISKLEAALGTRDVEEVSRLGHYIKGSAANLRLEDVRALGSYFESIRDTAGMNGDAQIKLEEMRKAFGEVKSSYS